VHIFKNFKRKTGNGNNKKCPCEVRMLYGIQLPDIEEEKEVKKSLRDLAKAEKGEIITVEEFRKNFKGFKGFKGFKKTK